MKKAIALLLIALMMTVFSVSCENRTEKKKAEARIYTVRFVTGNGGSDVASQSVREGEAAGKPGDDPTREGYAFERWSLNEKGEKAFDFEKSKITQDTTLYAVWTPMEYHVGDTGPAGGTIFYAPGSEQTSSYSDSYGNTVTYTWYYLEAAPKDLDKDYCFGWYRTRGINEAAGTKTEVGTGKFNTMELVRKMGSKAYLYRTGGDKGEYAAKACLDYVDEKGHHDWFLPSKDELDLMYTNLKDKGKGGSWVESWYLSSSEHNGESAWQQHFYDRYQYNHDRDSEATVRPVRAF